TITVPVLPDADTGQSESFYVNLNNPVNATISRGQGVGEIHADGVDVLGGLYTQTFNGGSKPFFDHSEVFQHEIGSVIIADPSRIIGSGYSVQPVFSNQSLVLRPGARDRITFPNLDPDVRVLFVALDVHPLLPNATATVHIVGENGLFDTIVR